MSSADVQMFDNLLDMEVCSTAAYKGCQEIMVGIANPFQPTDVQIGKASVPKVNKVLQGCHLLY